MSISEIIQYATECEQYGCYSDEFDAIRKGLEIDSFNAELYLMLGLYYFTKNIDQAYICLQHAYYCCEDKDEDSEIVSAIVNALSELGKYKKFSVRDTSIVILSYNDIEIMKECLKNVRAYTDPMHTEIVVVDNASTDGVSEWLTEQKDIIYYASKENLGFSKGCNIGYSLCNKENDVFFLNNDAVLTPASLLYLKLALYDSPDTGMVSGVSNNAMSQTIPVPDNTIKGCLKSAQTINLPSENPLEARARLTGFALLIRREACQSVELYDEDHTMIFDELFSPAYFEDDDLGIRINAAGWKEYLVHNSLIYHKGGEGFDKENKTMVESRQKFIDKWGFDIWCYIIGDEYAIEKLESCETDHNASFRILEVGCGMGATLSQIKYLYPNADVTGIEEVPFIAMLAKNSGHIICDNILEYDYTLLGKFDYILADLSALDEDNRAEGDQPSCSPASRWSASADILHISGSAIKNRLKEKLSACLNKNGIII